MNFNKFTLALAAAALLGAPHLSLAAGNETETLPLVTNQTPIAASAPTTVQKAALRLGYSLQFLTERQRRYLADVQGLSSIDEGEATEKYVDSLEAQSIALRKFEANTVTLALDDLVKIEGPEKALQSISPLSKMLSAPLPSGKKKESKDKRVAAILGTIDESRTVQENLTSLQFNLTPILKLQGGDESLWALELGRAIAARRAAPLTKASLEAQTKDVNSLLSRAPKMTPTSILANVRALAPPIAGIGTPHSGAGNLSGLLPSDAPAPPTAAARAAEGALLTAYGAEDVDGKLGK
ncbi:MAG: hypothetical protein ABIY70_09945 [Capsulimonas sp.]|uniref:hypothetical protein n=1 Tax=Capsulimonas sp. TaxID=2494211 RepID=UPI003266E82B